MIRLRHGLGQWLAGFIGALLAALLMAGGFAYVGRGVMWALWFGAFVAAWYFLDRPPAGQRHGRHLGLCTQCGYNLTGNVSGVCPECGRAAPRSAPGPDEL